MHDAVMTSAKPVASKRASPLTSSSRPVTITATTPARPQLGLWCPRGLGEEECRVRHRQAVRRLLRKARTHAHDQHARMTNMPVPACGPGPTLPGPRSRFQAPHESKQQQEDGRGGLAHGVKAHGDVHQAAVGQADVEAGDGAVGQHCRVGGSRGEAAPRRRVDAPQHQPQLSPALCLSGSAPGQATGALQDRPCTRQPAAGGRAPSRAHSRVVMGAALRACRPAANTSLASSAWNRNCTPDISSGAVVGGGKGIGRAKVAACACGSRTARDWFMAGHAPNRAQLPHIPGKAPWPMMPLSLPTTTLLNMPSVVLRTYLWEHQVAWGCLRPGYAHALLQESAAGAHASLCARATPFQNTRRRRSHAAAPGGRCGPPAAYAARLTS